MFRKIDRRAFVAGAGCAWATGLWRTANATTQASFTFQSEGQRMAGVLHAPATQPIAAVVMCGAWTAVKEQATGLYARALAERGYIALAFDHRYFGQSGGEPRQLENPHDKVRDVSNAVTALLKDGRTRNLPVMVVGICAGGGYALRAAADDDRIRAFAGVAGAYNDANLMRTRMGDAFDKLLARARMAEQKWRETKVAETIPAVAAAGGDVAMPFAEAFDYYGTRRGAVPNYVNGFAVQSYAHVLTWDAISAAPRVKIPVLVVHSEQAAMPDLAKRLLAEAAGSTRSEWLVSRNHVDFYDNPELVTAASDAVAAHFKRALA